MLDEGVEVKALRSQIVTSNEGRGGRRYVDDLGTASDETRGADSRREGFDCALGGLDRPVHAVFELVKPDEAADLGVLGGEVAEHVGDPLGLGAALLGGGDLAEDHRLGRGDLLDDLVVGATVELVEAAPAVAFGRVGARVVAVEAGPLDVAVAGVEGAQVLETVFEVDVRAPDPDRVVGADLVEDVVKVAPAADVAAGAVAVAALAQGNQSPFISQLKRRKKRCP